MTNLFKGLEENKNQSINIGFNMVTFIYGSFTIRIKYVKEKNKILMLFNDRLDTWCCNYNEMMYWVNKRLPDEFYENVTHTFMDVISSVLLDFWCKFRDDVELKGFERLTQIINPKNVMDSILNGSKEDTYLCFTEPNELMIQEYRKLLMREFNSKFGFSPETISIEFKDNKLTFRTSFIEELIERNRIDL